MLENFKKQKMEPNKFESKDSQLKQIISYGEEEEGDQEDSTTAMDVPNFLGTNKLGRKNL